MFILMFPLLHITLTPVSLMLRWLRTNLMLVIANAIAFHPRAILMALLVLQQSKCKVHDPGIAFVSLVEFILAN